MKASHESNVERKDYKLIEVEAVQIKKTTGRDQRGRLHSLMDRASGTMHRKSERCPCRNIAVNGITALEHHKNNYIY